MKKTSLYQLIDDLAERNGVIDECNEEIAQTVKKIDKIRSDLIKLKSEFSELESKADFYISEMKRINKDKKAGPLFQRHNIKDYWSKKQFEEYQSLLKNMSFKENNAFSVSMEDYSVYRISQGLIIKGKNNNYLLDPKNLKHGDWLVIPVFFGLFFSPIVVMEVKHWDQILIEAKGITTILPLAMINSIIASSIVGPAIAACYEKNPFIYNAEKIGKRLSYMKESFPS